jgi:hypothetical protein
MASVFDLKKMVVTYNSDKTEWKWKEYSLNQICKSDVYGSVKVNIGNKKVDLRTAVSYYQKLQDLKNWPNARTIKDIIWAALDEKSKQRIKAYYGTPEVRIASVNRENTGDDTIIAFYALNEENYYNGELEGVVPRDYKEYINRTIVIRESKDVRYTTKIRGIYEESHIIASNSDTHPTFSKYMETSPNYQWLPRAIEVAKQFGVEPNW